MICDWQLQGDSGSSLQLSVEINRWVQVGLVSFGAATGCVNDHPNGYSKISYYLDWIGTVTGMNFDWGNFSNWNPFVIFCTYTILCLEFNLVMDWIPKNCFFNLYQIYLVWNLVRVKKNKSKIFQLSTYTWKPYFCIHTLLHHYIFSIN